MGVRRNSLFSATKAKIPPHSTNRNEHSDGPIGAIARRFSTFMDDYRVFFNVARHNVSDKARTYLAGLVMKAPRKNMERMEEYVEGCDYQAQQQFISDSPWDHKALEERLARDVSKLLGGAGSTLVIDESGFSKKGVKSAGVARQWNGRQGKVDNCQVGVFAALTDGVHSALVDKRLYLPEEWTADPERCSAARIPGSEQEHRPKTLMAWEMIQSAVERDVRFDWVAMDAFYGAAPWLLFAIDDLGKRFVADVRCNQHVYAEDPMPYLPRRKQPKGRKFTKLRSRCSSGQIEHLFDKGDARKWRKIKVRESTKGHVEALASRKRVWLWDGQESQARCFWAVCTVDAHSGDTKWFLSNAPASTSLAELVTQHARRFWIERSFQDAKTSLGMADYQARGWVAWHHHMSMIMLAMLFMVRERKINQREVSLLTYTDIVELLGTFLPRADITPQDVFRNIERRHRKRQAAIDSARRIRKRRRTSPKTILTK